MTVQSTDRAVRREAAKVAGAALRGEGIRYGWLDIAVVSEAVMRREHVRWLGESGGTDVLAFDLRASKHADLVEGQLLVCRSVARRRARSRGDDWLGELLLYVVHGCLHLCGYDDKRPGDAEAMHRREDEILTRLGVGPVFARGAAPGRKRQKVKKSKSQNASVLSTPLHFDVLTF